MAKQSVNVLTLGKTPLTTILKLAWPTIIEQMMFTVLNFSDTAMVGALGAVATAAVGITSTSIWLSGSVISAVSVGLSIQLAQSVGAGNYKRAREVVGQSLLTSLVVGAALTLVFFSLHWNLPVWLGAEEAVVPHAQAYLQVIALSLLFNMLSSVFSSLLRCMGDTHTPLKYNFTAIILNVIFNFLLIFPSRDLTVFGFTFPMFGAGLGVAGAAWGTALSLAVSATLLFLSLCNKRREIHLSLKKEYLKPDKDILKNHGLFGGSHCNGTVHHHLWPSNFYPHCLNFGNRGSSGQHTGCFGRIPVLYAGLWCQRSYHNIGQPIHRRREKGRCHEFR